MSVEMNFDTENQGHGILSEEIEVLKSIYIDELDIKCNDNGEPATITIELHPSTAANIDKQYVCLTVAFDLPPTYPYSTPDITLKTPRGLDDDEIAVIERGLQDLAIQRLGQPMLYELIVFVTDSLTEGNIPQCACVICLNHFTDTDVFIRTKCYHFFHSFCLLRHITSTKKRITESLEQAPRHVAPKVADSEVVCPVCRKPITYDEADLHDAPPPAEEVASTNGLTDEYIIQRECLKKLFEKQKAQGGIIDLEAERNKYLVRSSSYESSGSEDIDLSSDNVDSQSTDIPVTPSAWTVSTNQHPTIISDDTNDSADAAYTNAGTTDYNSDYKNISVRKEATKNSIQANDAPCTNTSTTNEVENCVALTDGGRNLGPNGSIRDDPIDIRSQTQDVHAPGLNDDPVVNIVSDKDDFSQTRVSNILDTNDSRETDVNIITDTDLLTWMDVNTLSDMDHIRQMDMDVDQFHTPPKCDEVIVEATPQKEMNNDHPAGDTDNYHSRKKPDRKVPRHKDRVFYNAFNNHKPGSRGGSRLTKGSGRQTGCVVNGDLNGNRGRKRVESTEVERNALRCCDDRVSDMPEADICMGLPQRKHDKISQRNENCVQNRGKKQCDNTCKDELHSSEGVKKTTRDNEISEVNLIRKNDNYDGKTNSFRGRKSKNESGYTRISGHNDRGKRNEDGQQSVHWKSEKESSCCDAASKNTLNKNYSVCNDDIKASNCVSDERHGKNRYKQPVRCKQEVNVTDDNGTSAKDKESHSHLGKISEKSDEAISYATDLGPVRIEESVGTGNLCRNSDVDSIGKNRNRDSNCKNKDSSHNGGASGDIMECENHIDQNERDVSRNDNFRHRNYRSDNRGSCSRGGRGRRVYRVTEYGSRRYRGCVRGKGFDERIDERYMANDAAYGYDDSWPNAEGNRREDRRVDEDRVSRDRNSVRNGGKRGRECGNVGCRVYDGDSVCKSEGVEKEGSQSSRKVHDRTNGDNQRGTPEGRTTEVNDGGKYDINALEEGKLNGGMVQPNVDENANKFDRLERRAEDRDEYSEFDYSKSQTFVRGGNRNYRQSYGGKRGYKSNRIVDYEVTLDQHRGVGKRHGNRGYWRGYNGGKGSTHPGQRSSGEHDDRYNKWFPKRNIPNNFEHELVSDVPVSS